MNKPTFFIAALSVVLLSTACTIVSSPGVRNDSAGDPLVGSWRGKVQFTSGSFSSVKDLEFMYVFNAGGTMTESSNYDASPPVPPAYGVWRRIQSGQYEARYSFYSTKPPKGFEDITSGGGWSPAGRGVLVEEITLANDGKSFKSTIRYDAFDPTGKPLETDSKAEADVVRMGF